MAKFSINLCFGASHLYSATTLVLAPPVFNTLVTDLCRVRVLMRLSHPRPSVVTAPVYWGCPAGTHWSDPISRVRPDQSANSCCAVESPVLTFVGFPLTISFWLHAMRSQRLHHFPENMCNLAQMCLPHRNHELKLQIKMHVLSCPTRSCACHLQVHVWPC